jgi:hypothetical protein
MFFVDNLAGAFKIVILYVNSPWGAERRAGEEVLNLNGILTGEVGRVISKPWFTERLRHSDVGNCGPVTSTVWASSDEAHAGRMKGSVRVSLNSGLISQDASPNKETFIWGLLLILAQAEQLLGSARAVFDRGLNVLNKCKPGTSTPVKPLARSLAKDGIVFAITTLCHYRRWFFICRTLPGNRIAFFLIKTRSHA